MTETAEQIDVQDIQAIHGWLDQRGIPRYDEADVALFGTENVQPLKLSHRILRLVRKVENDAGLRSLATDEMLRQHSRTNALIEAAVHIAALDGERGLNQLLTATRERLDPGCDEREAAF